MPAYQLLRRFLVSNNQLKIKRYPKAKRFQLVFESKDYPLGSFTITHDTCCVSFFFWNQKRILSIALINYTLPLTPCHCFALILFMARRKVVKFFHFVWFWLKLEYISKTYSALEHSHFRREIKYDYNLSENNTESSTLAVAHVRGPSGLMSVLWQRQMSVNLPVM